MSEGYMGVQGAIEDTDSMINVPDGFDSRIYINNKALFTWNPLKTSNKLKLN